MSDTLDLKVLDEQMYEAEIGQDTEVTTYHDDVSIDIKI